MKKVIQTEGGAKTTVAENEVSYETALNKRTMDQKIHYTYISINNYAYPPLSTDINW